MCSFVNFVRPEPRLRYVMPTLISDGFMVFSFLYFWSFFLDSDFHTTPAPLFCAPDVEAVVKVNGFVMPRRRSVSHPPPMAVNHDCRAEWHGARRGARLASHRPFAVRTTMAAETVSRNPQCQNQVCHGVFSFFDVAVSPAFRFMARRKRIYSRWYVVHVLPMALR